MSRDRAEKIKRKAEWQARKQEKKTEELRSRIPLTLVGAERRSCGECQACCVVIGIEGDKNTPQKGVYTPCVHQCEKGCGVYSYRPSECRSYECLWQRGVLTQEEHRPDKLGIIIDRRRTGYGDKGTPPQEVLVLWETRPGAFDEPESVSLIKWIARNVTHPLVFNRFQEVEVGADGLQKIRLL